MEKRKKKKKKNGGKKKRVEEVEVKKGKGGEALGKWRGGGEGEREA